MRGVRFHSSLHSRGSRTTRGGAGVPGCRCDAGPVGRGCDSPPVAGVAQFAKSRRVCPQPPGLTSCAGMPVELVCAAAACASAATLFASLLAWERRKRQALLLELQQLREASERHARLRDEERKGRTRAEQQLRSSMTSSGAPTGDVSTHGSSVASTSDAGFVFRPIGTFSSCYRARCGTPRQGGIVPDALAVLRCSRDLNPAAALEGFAEYSHCWVLYVFHANTNLPREGRTVAARNGQRKGRVPQWQGLCMKVAPPRCPDPDLRVGVLACRTPHRPNPVGLSLARIVRVDFKAGEVVLAGLDVVDGTPCLDLKPYLPSYEAVPGARVPSWVRTSYEEPLMRVEWSPGAAADFRGLYGGGLGDDESSREADEAGEASGPRLRTQPFADAVELRAALEGTLALDIRSPVQRGRHPNPGPGAANAFFTGDLWFHEMHVTYSLLSLVERPASHEAHAFVRVQRVERRTPDLAVEA